MNPTEDSLRVRRALENIIGPREFTTECHNEDTELVYSNSVRDTLSHVRQTIHDLRIIDAARKRLLSNWNGTSTQIHFDKQAAFGGKLRIIDDSSEIPPLGTIEVGLIFERETEFEQFLQWFVPPTKNGKIVS